MKDRIYLDHAATAPLSKEVLAAMLPYLTECYGNASAVHASGREARKAVEKARKQVASAIGAEPAEILFTGSGSESDNLALKGIAFARRENGKHIITTAIEHPAVLNTCRWLEKQGFDVTYVMPDSKGRVSPEQIRKAVRHDTILISVMAANNEIGTIEPVEEIGSIAKELKILFHSDAVQAAGAIPVNVNSIHADLLSISAHKFSGPKGVGALYVRHGTRMEPLVHGGEQERHMRAGTENVAGIVGMGKAIESAVKHLPEDSRRNRILRDRLAEGILSAVQDTDMNGPREGRLPNNCNIRFGGIDGEALLLRLDMAGIAGSSGSACTAGSQEISHVLKSIGLTETQAKGSLRLTVGPDNTEEEIDEAVIIIRDIVEDLRRMYHKK